MTGLIFELSRWAIPFLLFFIPSFGFLRGVRVYEAFVAGAEDGFKVAVKIIPFLVGMLVAIGVFRASGAMDLLAHALDPVLRLVGIPGEVLPLAILRPLSGGGALGVAAELISEYGPDSFIGRLASVMQGSTDTTVWVTNTWHLNYQGRPRPGRPYSSCVRPAWALAIGWKSRTTKVAVVVSLRQGCPS